MNSIAPGRLTSFATCVCLLALAVGLSGCGCCCITGGGTTTHAERLEGVHRKTEVGIGGPGWWLFKHLGVRFIKEDDLTATLALRGVKSIQVSTFELANPSEARQREILDLYAAPLRNKGWEQFTRVHDAQKTTVVYADVDEDSFRGIFVIAMEGNQMNVVQVRGNIRPEMLAALNTKLVPLGASWPTEEPAAPED